MNDIVYADILSQAITGEVIGAMNFSSLAELSRGVEREEALEHAASERGHAMAFQNLALELGLKVRVDAGTPYWHRVRQAFLLWAGRGDTEACLLLQEFMLESFAISMYRAVGKSAGGSLAEVFLRIASEEEGHLEHALAWLSARRNLDPSAFDGRLEQVHGSVMPALSEMVATEDRHGPCGLCVGACVKKSLPEVGLDISRLRGQALNHYLRSLDRLGVPGLVSLRWISRLPS